MSVGAVATSCHSWFVVEKKETPNEGLEPSTPCLEGRCATELRQSGFFAWRQFVTRSYITPRPRRLVVTTDEAHCCISWRFACAQGASVRALDGCPPSGSCARGSGYSAEISFLSPTWVGGDTRVNLLCHAVADVLSSGTAGAARCRSNYPSAQRSTLLGRRDCVGAGTNLRGPDPGAGMSATHHLMLLLRPADLFVRPLPYDRQCRFLHTMTCPVMRRWRC